MLAIGLKSLVGEIAARVGPPQAIAIQELRYKDSDFQLEGLAAAVIGWAIAEFGLAHREIPVSFNRKRIDTCSFCRMSPET